jgi:hypothetical protein
MTTQFESQYNGVKMDRPAGLGNETWAKVEKSLHGTESGRLFKSATKEAAATSLGNTFAVPASASIEFKADRIKRDKAEDQSAARRGRPPSASHIIE